jgi:hypothetical protein
VAQRILTELRSVLADRGVVVENVLLRDIQLPETSRWRSKLSKGPSRTRYRWNMLTKEKQEAERKRSRLKGRPISRRRDPRHQRATLQWKGIEATEKLALLPYEDHRRRRRKDGLPLILGVEQAIRLTRS